ncbi:MAG: hypothetical protein IJ567_01200 [Lachnospiraceae bacterium]|nr:hypothetical protein [Lachnospiraceae bacterium]
MKYVKHTKSVSRLIVSLLFLGIVTLSNWSETMVVRASNKQEIYRLYDQTSGRNFYTSNQNMRDFLMGIGWRYDRSSCQITSLRSTLVKTDRERNTISRYKESSHTSASHADTKNISIHTEDRYESLEEVFYDIPDIPQDAFYDVSYDSTVTEFADHFPADSSAWPDPALALTANHYSVENVHVPIEGCEHTYYLLWVSDLHICIPSDEIADSNYSTILARHNGFSVSNGVSSDRMWAELPNVLDDCDADAILFGGDMIDFCSEANVSCLRNGLEQLHTPYLYIRADHDSHPFFLANPDPAKAKTLQDGVCNNSDVFSMEFDDFCILAVNNSTDQMTREGLDTAKAVFAAGKPVIILSHVPYASKADRSLQESSRAAWGSRELVWGSASSYVPNETTQEFLDLIYAEDSPVVEILCGHLHYTWDGYLTGNVREHVFSPAFQGVVGVITIDGATE